MMKLNDAFAIALTKFKTRKLRNAFAAFTISLGIIIILVFLFGVAGVLDVGKKAFVDSLGDRHFALETFPTNKQIQSIEAGVVKMGFFEGVDSTTPSEEADSPEKYLEKYSADGVQVAYLHRLVAASTYGFGIQRDGTTDEFEKKLATVGWSAAVAEPMFVQDFVYADYHFDALVDGKIPVIIPKSATQADAYTVPFDVTQKELYEKFQVNAEKLIGQTFTVTLSESAGYSYGVFFGGAENVEPSEEAQTETILPTKTTIEVVVVGFAADGFYSSPLYDSYSLIFPNWALEQNTTIAALFAEPSEWRMVSEFASREERDRFVDRRHNTIDNDPVAGLGSYVQQIPSRFEMLEDLVRFFRSAGLGVGGFFLVVSSFFLMTTLGKIISDSQKEIGVFRAVGAQKRDVKKIYFAYAWLLVTGGFVIGVFIAVMLDGIASLKWGEDLFYQMMNAGVSASVSEPAFLFVHVVPLYIIAVYAALIVLGVLASAIPIRRASKIDPIQVLKDV